MSGERLRDSTRDLLASVDESWGTPPPLAPISSPDIASLDAGWADDEADDVVEEPLPDEHLDPVAYAKAKREREQRAAARREKRRMKSTAKREKQRARDAAAREKQKAKKPRSSRPDAAETRAPRAEDVADVDEAEEKVSLPAPRTSITTNTRMLAIAVAIFLAAAAIVAATMK
jgi:hypothetical protein